MARTRAERIRTVVVPFLITRFALLGLVYLSTTAIPLAVGRAELLPGHPFWSALAEWDSGWYDRVARAGYFVEGAQSDVAFFPLYPYLARWLGLLLGHHVVAGILLSQLALLAALFAMAELAGGRGDEDGARRAVWLVLVHPATVFFSAFYPESLFLACTAGAFVCLERGRMLGAGLLGAAAAFARPAGMFLLPALALQALHRNQWRLDPRLAFRGLWLLLIPAALAGFMLILRAQVGDPLAFLRAQGGWDREAAFPLTTLICDLGRLDLSRLAPGISPWAYPLDIVASVGLLFVGVAAWRAGPGHALFALLVVLSALASGRSLSMARFSATVPALYLVLARGTVRPAVERPVLVAFASLAALYTVLFARGYWAG